MSHAADKRMLRRLLSGGGRQIGALLTGLLVFPVIARMLSHDGLGIWALLGSASFMIGLADLGLSTAVQRSAVTAEHTRTRRTLSLALLSQLFFLPVFGVIAYFALGDFSSASPALRADAHYATVVTLCAGGVMSFTQPYRMFVLARGGVNAVARARTVAAVLQVVCVYGGFLLVQTLLVPAAALLAANIVDYALNVRAARALDDELPFFPKWPAEWGEARHALRDGAAALAINAATTMALRIDLFIVERVAPLAVVAAYGVAGRAVDMSYLLAKQTTAALMPQLGDPAQRSRAVRVGTGVFAAVVMSGMMALALNGQPLLVLWVGDVAAGSIAALVLVLLSTAAMIMSSYEMASSMVMLGGRTAWPCAIPIVAGTVTNLVISIAGAPHFGVAAVAGATIVGNAITMLLMWTNARKILHWDVPKIALALAPPFVAILLSFAVGFALSPFAHRNALTSVISCGVTMSLGVGAALATMRWLSSGSGPTSRWARPTPVPHTPSRDAQSLSDTTSS